MIEREAWYKEADFEKEWKSLLANLKSHWNRALEMDQDILMRIRRMAERLGKEIPVYFTVDEDTVEAKFQDFIWDYAISSWDTGYLRIDWDEGDKNSPKPKYDDLGTPLMNVDNELYLQCDDEVSGRVDLDIDLYDIQPDYSELDEDDPYYEDSLQQAVDEARDEAVSNWEQEADRRFTQAMNNFPADVSRVRIQRTHQNWSNPEDVTFEQVGDFLATLLDPMRMEEEDREDMVIIEDITPNF